MDTSEQYIKMSVQAWLELWQELQWGDAVYSPSRELVGRVGYSLDGAGKPQLAITRGESCILIDADDWVVVFRQDQLQEMLEFPVGTFKDNFWTAFSKLNEWGFSEKFLDYIPVSMEQLWLAFVMKAKYNKTWDGESWL